MLYSDILFSVLYVIRILKERPNNTLVFRTIHEACIVLSK